MTYYIGQTLGLFGTACCLILPLLRQKWQMLTVNALINLFCGLNIVMIGQVGSVVVVYIVAVLQSLVALRHLRRGSAISKGENILFLCLYVVCGSLDLHSPVDVLPVAGAVFNMAATFQKDVQKTRYLLLGNASIFLVYYFLVRSTSAFSCVCTLTTTVIAICRHKKQTEH